MRKVHEQYENDLRRSDAKAAAMFGMHAGEWSHTFASSAATTAQRWFGWMMPLAKAGASEQGKMDDRSPREQPGTVSPAEAQPVVAAETRRAVDGFLRFGCLGEETVGSFQVQRLAGHAALADQEIHRMALDQPPV